LTHTRSASNEAGEAVLLRGSWLRGRTSGRPFAAFKESHGGPIARYSGAPLAYEVDLVAREGGYRGVALSYLVDSPERVDELMAQAERAGAKIIKPPRAEAWGVYIGYLTDPGGNLWNFRE
jgi:uncharacterized protein